MGLAITLAASIGVLRFVAELLLWRRTAVREAIVEALPVNTLATVLGALAVTAYAIGAIYFLFRGSQEAAADGAASLFSSPQWQERARTFIELTSLLFLALFVVLTRNGPDHAGPPPVALRDRRTRAKRLHRGETAR